MSNNSWQKPECLRRRVDVAQVWSLAYVGSGFCPRHVNVNLDGFRVSAVGLPSPSGQASSKTASTIVRNSNAVASAVDYANGSGSPFETISVDDDLPSTHAATTDPSSDMTGKTLHIILNDDIIPAIIYPLYYYTVTYHNMYHSVKCCYHSVYIYRLYIKPSTPPHPRFTRFTFSEIIFHCLRIAAGRDYRLLDDSSRFYFTLVSISVTIRNYNILPSYNTQFVDNSITHQQVGCHCR